MLATKAGELRQKLTGPLLKELGSWSRESVNRRQDDSLFPVHITSDVVFGADGEPVGLVSSCQDISERKAAEEALRRSPDSPSLLTLAGETRLAIGELEAARELIGTLGEQVIEFLLGVFYAFAHLVHGPDEGLPLLLEVGHVGKDL